MIDRFVCLLRESDVVFVLVFIGDRFIPSSLGLSHEQIRWFPSPSQGVLYFRCVPGLVLEELALSCSTGEKRPSFMHISRLRQVWEGGRIDPRERSCLYWEGGRGRGGGGGRRIGWGEQKRFATKVFGSGCWCIHIW